MKEGEKITDFASDALGKLKSVTLPDSKVISYILDWQGRRIQKEIDGSTRVRSIHEGPLQLSAEVNLDTNEIKEYVFATNINSADYMRVGASLYRIIKDHLGSPRIVVNASTGKILQRMDYNEWGKVTRDTNPGFQGFGYAGGLYDPDTKLVKFGARDYDSNIGRWLSKDPIGFTGGDPNLYGYVLNDPVNFVDPMGYMRLPKSPLDLPTGWDIDPTHKDPNGTRWRYKGSDRCLDFHKGRKGEKGWKGKDHWHDSEKGGKHLRPGDEVSDPKEPAQRYFWDTVLPPIPFPIFGVPIII